MLFKTEFPMRGSGIAFPKTGGKPESQTGPGPSIVFGKWIAVYGQRCRTFFSVIGKSCQRAIQEPPPVISIQASFGKQIRDSYQSLGYETEKM